MKKPVFWVLGSAYECDEAVKTIVSKYPKYEITIVDGTSDGVETVFSHLEGRDIFGSDKKVVRVKSLPADFDLICNCIDSMGKDRVLIIEAPTEFLRSRRKVYSKKTKLYKKVQEVGKVLYFPVVVPPQKAVKWVVDFVAKSGKTIEAEVSSLLANYKNNNLDMLHSEMSKIIDFVGKKKKIESDDVLQCIQQDHEFIVWSFLDSMTSCDEQKALHELGVMINSDGFLYEVPNIINLLISRFEMLLFARSIGKTFSVDKLKSELGQLKKEVKPDKEEAPITDFSVSSDAFCVAPSAVRSMLTTKKYSDGFIYMFSNSPVNRAAVGKTGTIRLVQILSALYFSFSYVRMNWDKARCKSFLINMVRTVCGKLEVNKFKSFYEVNYG